VGSTLLKILITPQFLEDFKRHSAGRDATFFKEAVKLLEQQLPLPLKACDCPLVNAPGRWNCRVGFDWWVIYRCDIHLGTITLEQTGGFYDLFE